MIPSCLEGHEAPGTPVQAFVGIQPVCENTPGLSLLQCMQWALASLLRAAQPSTPQDNARHHPCIPPSPSCRVFLVGAGRTLSWFGICKLCGEVVLHLSGLAAAVCATTAPLNPPGV